VLGRCLRRFFPQNGLPKWGQEIAVHAQRNAQGRNDVTRLDLIMRRENGSPIKVFASFS
jgi:hypothetical protein